MKYKLLKIAPKNWLYCYLYFSIEWFFAWVEVNGKVEKISVVGGLDRNNPDIQRIIFNLREKLDEKYRPPELEVSTFIGHEFDTNKFFVEDINDAIMKSKKDSTGLVKLFDRIGNDIKSVTCSEDCCLIDLNIKTNDGKRYVINIGDIYCIEWCETEEE